MVAVPIWCRHCAFLRSHLTVPCFTRSTHTVALALHARLGRASLRWRLHVTPVNGGMPRAMCQRATRGRTPMNLQATRGVVCPSPPLSFACDPASGRAVRRHVRERAVAGGWPELADDAEAVA